MNGRAAAFAWRPEDLIELVGCPLCSCVRSELVARRADGLPVFKCSVCGLGYVNPRPGHAALTAYYGEGYFKGQAHFHQGRDYLAQRRQGVLRKELAGYASIAATLNVRGKRVLEVGCADGGLLVLLRQLGARDVVGIDISDYAVTHGRARYGLDLRCSTLETAEFEHPFDLIVMVDLVEHVEDLRPFLSKAVQCLEPGGSLFLLTPNFGAVERFRSEALTMNKDFEHLQYLSARSIRAVCQSFGLKLVSVQSQSNALPLASYPRLLPARLHALLYPRVGVANALARWRFSSSYRRGADCGHDLICVLRAAEFDGRPALGPPGPGPGGTPSGSQRSLSV